MFSGINVYNLITKKGSNKLFKCLVSKISKYIFENNCVFRIQGVSKRVKPSKSPPRKFDPKTILSLLIKRK